MNLAWVQPGPFELLIILIVILLLFGGKKLPGLSRALGKSLSEFKKGKQEGESTASGVTDEADDTESESNSGSAGKSQ